jgi:hypothetical protein
MSSWSMSECVKISIIISVMLRCWLKAHHIRKFYHDELLREFSLKNRRDAFTSVNIIISCFAKLTKNNSLISSFQLFVKNRKTFHEQILRARHSILKLMNASNKFFKNRSNTRDISDTGSVISCNDTDDTSNIRLFNAKKNEIKDHLNTLSNFHIKLHFERMMKEYDVLWNTNVLFDEDRHRFFKQVVLITNNRKSKRQLLFKNVVRFIIKVVISKTFIHTQSEIISQMLRFQNQCFNLLRDLNYHICNELNDDLFMNEFFSIHIKSCVRDRLKNACVKRLNLSIKVSEMLNMSYEHLMQNAMNADNLQVVNWNNRSLYWYEECFFTFQVTDNRSSYWYEDCSLTFQFTDNRASYWYEECSLIFQFTNKRCTFHINDHVRLIFEEIAQVFHIYFHSFNQHAVRRVYVWIRIFESASYMNDILQLKIFRLTELQRIVSLSFIEEEKSYIISISKNVNHQSFDNLSNLLHCNRMINFLWQWFN